ncbi:Alpha-1,2-mannosyltransferase MNN23 [Candida albicans]|uniref:Alpha-1,2-mannosyltransferase MNN23 n=2 Tax=Candida albicans TaxID=5476 RepID=MNN23_CANAL|nr:Mnn23p [Candida albicans SC5314]Q5AP90.2 RecName: Full=Alpha-1,2-mannosyltransferase MNN23 [Candida albicans SC5314]KAF6069661.1 Alpha-1,2-mannosyltransferase MNN23 [Candida albicans]KGQ97990.1 alpha 1,2-mannosyltransferase [Candida albicans P37005]KGR22639.1 alpha 1,2-mannosyltransferase [Candida albicans P37037]KHC60308.1 alpha 1,2-mannosyltransferase [Candida albicans P37039]AOW26638.1 Mnn23p [Candida albicans SC5314]|eukprot:XP_723558.2 Mnn23p [Candida albicans SC5314]
MSINFLSIPRNRFKAIGVLSVTCILIYVILHSSIITTDFDVSDYGDKFIPSIIFDDNNDNGENLKDPQPELDNDKGNGETDTTTSNSMTTAHTFWKGIFDTFDKYKMDLGQDPENAVSYVDKLKQKQGPLNKEVLLSKAIVSSELMKHLKEKHSGVVEDLPSVMPGSVYNKGSKGVVIIGGGKFSWLAYLALVQLRNVGSKLPVEIVMPSRADYEKELEFCENTLPEMQASCVVLPDVLGEAVMKNRKFASYQFKALALVVTSFEHILLLDSDNMIVSNPDEIFESKLYHQYGMITWPDYWKRTISPLFYDVAEIEVNENKRVRYNRFPLYNAPNVRSNIYTDQEREEVPFHDLQGSIAELSTESGQLIINKHTHGKTILLALYYNFYGPNLFYKLFSLGEQGEGDKDTFVAAAVVTRQDYYQVKSFIKTFGYADSDDKFQGVSMGQRNPLIDRKHYEDHVLALLEKDSFKSSSIADQIEQMKKFENEDFDQHNSIPLFTVHCNYPKLDPKLYMSRDDLYDEKEKKLKYRLYGNLKYTKEVVKDGETGTEASTDKVQIDFELQQWQHMQDILCLKKIYFTHFIDNDMNELCQFIENQVAWLSKSQN